MTTRRAISLDSLPLYASDEQIGAAILGPARAKDWCDLVPMLELMPGFPRIDDGHGARSVSEILRWYDEHNGLAPADPGTHRSNVNSTDASVAAGDGETVYVVGFSSYVKIGWTKDRDPSSRIASLQVGCPQRLVLYGTIRGGVDTEKALHARFAKYRLEGEWFCRGSELAAWIEGGCEL